MRLTLLSALALSGTFAASNPVPSSAGPYACGAAYTEPDFAGDVEYLWLKAGCVNIPEGLAGNISSVRQTDDSSSYCMLYAEADCPQNDDDVFPVYSGDEYANMPIDWDDVLKSYECDYLSNTDMTKRANRDGPWIPPKHGFHDPPATQSKRTEPNAAIFHSESHLSGYTLEVPYGQPSSCVPLSSIWDKAIQSLEVIEGSECSFYQSYNCTGSSFTVAPPAGVSKSLPNGFDKAISSYQCHPASNQSMEKREDDDAVYFYKEQDLCGESEGIAPGHFSLCYDLQYDVIGGGDWDNVARSVRVIEGWKCTFYDDQRCTGLNFELVSSAASTLDARFDRALSSVRCWREEGASPAESKRMIPVDDLDLVKRDDYATHLFKQQGLAGDHLDIRPGTVCINLYNVFGGWDNAVRSIQVTAGNKCQYWENENCAGSSFTMTQGVKNTLTPAFDASLSSVQCWSV
ncbi:uncharacterized protein BDZ99DRAFT_576182 [Mytilinidion resinicola]|uniref:Uncharacterized protein n=1 Tax=Mytilinidion resinicola TaxID=574789 RepID=A0A6A6Y356_9PEZI|nr:uncharacterized protein BDZ99DRAFT_576182 [Mytilinidion resinicola]KAF2803266.1 hypothetical protein BDZ99DRAFT_576182 [Mytilinidion resinicola]